MKLTAHVTTWSSVVGTSVQLRDETGRVVSLLSILLAGTREQQMAIAEHVAAAINERSR